MNTKIYFCIDKVNKKPISAGRLPEVWGNITGLSGVSDAAASDLTWAGYPGHGFMDEAAAKACGVKQADLDAMLETGSAVEAGAMRSVRDEKLAATVDRINPLRWEAMTDAQKNQCRTYRQQMLSISDVPGFPWDFVWPSVPDCIAP